MNGKMTSQRRGGLGKKGKVERLRAKNLARSTQISFGTAETIILSWAFARCQGWRLNRSISIAFKANLCPSRTVVALGRFLKLAGDWLRTKGVTPAYVWVIENPPDADEHAHIVIHLPAELRADFARLQRGWLVKTGTYFGAGVIKSENLQCFPDEPIKELGPLRYLLKGCGQQTRAFFGIDHRGSQGVVEGKRCGVAQSIGCQARKRHSGVLGALERPSGGGQDLKKPDIATAPSPDETAK